MVSLAKPGVTAANALMVLGGLAIANNADRALAFFAFLGTALTVASAGALNMLLERESDAAMERTASRPLPSGRMHPGVSAMLGIVWGTAGLLVLAVFVNPLTAWLGAAAHIVYVCVYTPSKTLHWSSVYPGALAGAAPPLMGWTAAAGTIDMPGIALFAILFLWQIPHVMAIGIFRGREYRAAGVCTFSAAASDRAAAVHAFLVCLLLSAATFLPWILGSAGAAYLACALPAAALYSGCAFWTILDTGRARLLFVVSLVYLPAAAGGLALGQI